MRPDDKDKQWGTIFLDASHESTMEKLDAMQAASRREQVQKRTEQEYLEKVRAKATERAKEILGEAYTERQKVLDEAKQDAEHMRLEMQGQYAFAATDRAEAQRTLEAAQEELRKAEAIREAAQEEGFNAGLEQAQQELESFRAAMGASVAGVLAAIHSQCGVIFEGWRQEMTELLKVCVAKGTGMVLDEQYPLVLEQLVMEAVRQLDDRRCITLRVHPDDEAAVADMFASARERLPNIGQWIVSGDLSLQLGGLIAESQSGTVDSRLELHSQLVENILQHLVLPASILEAEADRSVAEAVRQEAEKIAQLAPPVQEPLPPTTLDAEPLLPEADMAPPLPQALQDETQTAGVPPLVAPPVSPAPLAEDAPALDDHQLDATLGQAEQEARAEQEAQAEQTIPPMPPTVDEAAIAPSLQAVPPEPGYAAEAIQPNAPQSTTQSPGQTSAQAAHVDPSSTLEPTRDELEHELFDLSPSPQDDVLAQGGFLDSPAPDGERHS